MIRGMYSAISGLRTHQTMLDVTANNLANVNTVGYKCVAHDVQGPARSRPCTAGRAAGPNTGGTNSAQVGLGVQLGSIDAVMGDGSLQSTGDPLDVAIQGEGWFRVGLGDPSTTPADARPSSTTPARATSSATTRATCHRRRLLRRGPHTATTPARRLHPDPGRRLGVAVGTDGDGQLHPGRRRHARDAPGTISLAKFPNEKASLRLSGNRWDATPAAGTEHRRHARRQTSARPSAARWRCPTSTSPASSRR